MHIPTFARSGALILIVAALGACAAASEPGGNFVRGPEGFATVEAPPVYALLGQRERLELTSDQVVALDSIGAWVDAENSASRAALRDEGVVLATDTSTTRFRSSTPLSATSRTALDSLLESNRAAVEGVHALLTPPQRATVCELFDPDRGRADGRTPRRRTTTAITMGYRWPWCGPVSERVTATVRTIR